MVEKLVNLNYIRNLLTFFAINVLIAAVSTFFDNYIIMKAIYCNKKIARQIALR